MLLLQFGFTECNVPDNTRSETSSTLSKTLVIKYHSLYMVILMYSFMFIPQTVVIRKRSLWSPLTNVQGKLSRRFLSLLQMTFIQQGPKPVVLKIDG